tara:strand:+ start:58 stop:501 length:444 start_codon:yes stop_codon:yes gene_type:complete
MGLPPSNWDKSIESDKADSKKGQSCPSCDIELPDDLKFCTDCGTPLPEKKSNKALNTVLIVFGLLTIGLLGWIFYYDASSEGYVGFELMFPILFFWILLITTSVLGCVRLSRTGLPQPLKWFLIILSSSPAWIWIPAIFISASLYEG